MEELPFQLKCNITEDSAQFSSILVQFSSLTVSMLESSSVFKMNSKAAPQKTIVLLSILIQKSSDSQCSQTDNSFLNKPQLCKPKATVARNQNSIMNQNLAFGKSHSNGWTSDLICCSMTLSE